MINRPGSVITDVIQLFKMNPSNEMTCEQATEMYGRYLNAAMRGEEECVPIIRELALAIAPSSPYAEFEGIRMLRGLVAQCLFSAAYTQLQSSFSIDDELNPAAQELFDLSLELALSCCKNKPDYRLLSYISHAIQTGKGDDARTVRLRKLYDECVAVLDSYTLVHKESGLKRWPTYLKWVV